MRVNKVHCFFEQSGTFKNEFIKLDVPAEDYDIQNEFGQTDHQIDLFSEIEKAYEGETSVFDTIKKDDLIMAFFPCIYFEAQQMMYFQATHRNLQKKTEKEKVDEIIKRAEKREQFYILLRKFVAVCNMGGHRMVLENPATPPHYLLFTQNFFYPTFIDKDRTMRGDWFKKPTAYWFFNCDPVKGRRSYCKPKEIKRVESAKGGNNGLCSTERSLISPVYARNFICDFILGVDNEYTERSLF